MWWVLAWCNKNWFQVFELKTHDYLKVYALIKYEEGIEGLHKGDSEGQYWLRSLDVRL